MTEERTGQVEPAGEGLGQQLEGLQERIRAAEAQEERRKLLVCYPHAARRDDEAAVDACAAAGAHEGCELARWPEKCPRKRLELLFDVVDQRLNDAKVESREKQLLRAAARVHERAPLRDTDALRTVRAVLSSVARPVELEASAEVSAAGAVRRGLAMLTGSEILLCLGGNRGVGKTLAACYAIAREGGLYTTAYLWSRPSGEVDMAAAKRAPVLVIDQLGRENLGASRFTLTRIEEVLDARYAGRRLSILVGNIGWKEGCDTDTPGFCDRYGEIVEDRLKGDGIFVLCGGESLRPQLREDAIAAAAERNAGRRAM